jgi:hypothetical protein
VADPIAEVPGRRIDWSRATVRDLLDDPATWTAVAEVAASTGTTPQGETQAARMLGPYLGASATFVAHALAPDDRLPGAKDLRREIADVFAGAR